MAEEEKPTIEEPKVEDVKAKEEVDIDGLIAELTQAGVTNPKQLQGKLTASRETGHVVNELGDARREIAELKTLMQEGSKQPVGDAFEGYGEQSPTDVKAMLNTVLDERDAKAQQANAALQKRQMEAWNTITTDEDYALVEPIWKDKLKDPTFVYQIQSGVVDPVRAYSTVVRGYYKGIAQKSLTAIDQLRGGTPKVKVPHVETGERAGQLPPDNEIPENIQVEVERLTNQKARVDKGGILTSDEETDALMDLINIQDKTA